jgi:hypothetical protein
MAEEEDMVELVLARLSTMPENIKIHIGTKQGSVFERDDLIDQVKKGTKIGKYFVHMQHEYIKASINGFSA